MSFAGACPNRTHRHVVVLRNRNFSAFNEYRETPSAYSEVRCVETRARWRSNAKLVDQLPDATRDDLTKLGVQPGFSPTGRPVAGDPDF